MKLKRYIKLAARIYQECAVEDHSDMFALVEELSSIDSYLSESDWNVLVNYMMGLKR